jgi:hypothetical protein
MGTTPVPIDTYTKLASMRQIHGAIEHIYRGDYECAITLAYAAEGMLSEPVDPYLRHKVKDFSKREDIKAAGSETDPNVIGNWLKHGTINNVKTGDRIIPIPSEESVAWICRAISKYRTECNDLSPQMKSFCDWAQPWLRKELGRE